MPVEPWTLFPFFLLGAFLYTSVGHGGATVYLGILILAGYATVDIATTVLVLNVVAASLAFVHFRLAGHLRPRLLWPLLLASVPGAFLGARLPLGATAIDAVLGVALLVAALRFLLVAQARPPARPVPPRVFLLLALPLGGVLGFLAGATGIGGGIFLSPLLVLVGWASIREAASVASAFIVLNSLAGIVARTPSQPLLVDLLLPALVAVFAGAVAGGWLGARRLPPRGLQRLLGVVLLVAVARIAIDLANGLGLGGPA